VYGCKTPKILFLAVELMRHKVVCMMCTVFSLQLPPIFDVGSNNNAILIEGGTA